MCRKMVAFSKWQYPHSLTEKQQAKREEFGLGGNRLRDEAPEGYNVQLSDDFYGKIEEKHRMWVDDSRDYGESGQVAEIWCDPLSKLKVR